jgi:PAS domain S-box-containing protein
MSSRRNSTEIGPWVRALLETTREFSVLFIDDHGRISAWLGASEYLFGYTEAEAVGMPFGALFTPEDRTLGLDRQECQVALSGGRSEDDRWHVRRDGSRFWGSGVLEAVYDDAGRVAVLAKTVRDRTDTRVQIETQANRLAESERLNDERLAFLVALAHEMRNQLSPVANAVSTLCRTPAQPPTARTLALLHDKVQVLTRLLNDLADASRAALVRPDVAFERVKVQAAIAQAVDTMAGEMMRRGQAARVTLPDADLWIEADPARLDQMLVNLLGNASKFSPDGGIVQVSATLEADMLAIRIEDHGMGIAAEVLPQIFELFTRETHQGGPSGLGVGLAVVKQLAMLHAGFIEARSPGQGKGAIFTLRLPVRQPQGIPRSA